MSCIAAVMCHNNPLQIHRILAEFGTDNIVVIDNGSPTPLQFPVPILRFQEHVNIPFAWNRAMPFLSYFDYVWMLQDDVQEVDRAKMLQLHAVINFLEAHVLTPSFNSDYKDLQPRADGVGVRRVQWLEWFCPMVSTKWWREMMGFDPFYTTPNGASLELCYRARQKGHAAIFVSDIVHTRKL